MITIDDMAKATAKALDNEALKDILKDHPELFMFCLTFAADIASELFGGEKNEDMQ